jgi:predicted XRE-type DNA-binding protein
MADWVDPVPALKRQLADEVLALSDGQSQTWAAWALHLSRARVSELRNGRLDNVSLECLVRCLSRRGHIVEVQIQKAASSEAGEKAGWGGARRVWFGGAGIQNSNSREKGISNAHTERRLFSIWDTAQPSHTRLTPTAPRPANAR